MSRERNIGYAITIGATASAIACGTAWELFRDGRRYVGSQIVPQSGIIALTFRRCNPQSSTVTFEREMFFRDVNGYPRLHSTLVVHTDQNVDCK